MFNKEDLIKLFSYAKDNNLSVALELTVPTREETEIIITANSNLDYKLDYYLNNYSDNLELIKNTNIKILNGASINVSPKDIFKDVE